MTKWKVVRVSPKICHILFSISCVLLTSKKICQVKKSLSPTVWHNSLAKLRSNLHQEPWEKNKIIFMPSTSWKLKSGTLLCYLFLFSPSHLTRNHDANRAPRAYLRAGGWFFPSCQKLPSLLPNCWRSIFNVFAKNQRWQLDLPNCWRCSKVSN